METPRRSFSERQIQQYSREIILKQVGGKGLAKLLDSTVGIVGAGGLGCPASVMLATAGVGHLKVIDGDLVDVSNLPRQFLYGIGDVGKNKTTIMKQRLESLNPDVEVEAITGFLEKANVDSFLNDCDYVIDASDNFATKFLVNDACVAHDIPFVIAGVVQFVGQVLSVIPRKTACYRCVFPQPDEEDEMNSCSGAGVMGTMPAIAGNIQANEAILHLIGARSGLPGTLLLLDITTYDFQKIKVSRHGKCDACAEPGKNFYKSNQYPVPNACDVPPGETRE